MTVAVLNEVRNGPNEEPFHLLFERSELGLILRFDGNLMSEVPTHFADEMLAALAGADDAAMIIDLRSSECVVSTVMGFLVRVCRTAMERDMKVLAYKSGPRIEAIWDVLGLRRFIHSVADEATAAAIQAS